MTRWIWRRRKAVYGGQFAAGRDIKEASINYSTWLLDMTVDLVNYPNKDYITPGQDREWAEGGLHIEVKNRGKFEVQLHNVPALLFTSKSGFEARYQPIVHPVEKLANRCVYHVPADHLRSLFKGERWKQFGVPHMVRACVDLNRDGARGPIRVLGKSWLCCCHIAPYWMPK
ncbi:hypothetical protein M3398_29165 [Streptomyces albidoflavus]|uniref:hypothetical protein n=1 Tax=Streptomyces albidoflavus TaxID=1886 RepID=UPI0020C17D7E|nr:hypothetical protein [Streptomyces albidoflavus]MCL6281341.1 hypothetical protein [Streptomyces albidoflavus]